MAVSDTQPDFYLSGGEGRAEDWQAVRLCWKIGWTKSTGASDILVVRIDPPLPVLGTCDPGEQKIGLASRSTAYKVDDFGPDEFAMAVVWTVKELTPGKFLPDSSIGLATLWRHVPTKQGVR